MQTTDKSRAPSTHDLEAMVLEVVLPPRIARRLRCQAADERRSPERVAGRLLAEALVPDPHDRRRLVRLDLADIGLGA